MGGMINWKVRRYQNDNEGGDFGDCDHDGDDLATVMPPKIRVIAMLTTI